MIGNNEVKYGMLEPRMTYKPQILQCYQDKLYNLHTEHENFQGLFTYLQGLSHKSCNYIFPRKQDKIRKI